MARRGKKNTGRSRKKKSGAKPYRLAGEAAGGVRAIGAILFKKDGETAFGRIAGAALLTIIAASAAFGVAPLREHVGHVRADPLDVRFDWPRIAGESGTWMPRSLQRNLIETALVRLSIDPYDADSLEEAQWALLQSGWFKDPGPTLTRKPGGVVEVEGRWRTPAAVVRYASVDHLVADGGVLLPPEYRAGAAWPLRVIEGPWAGPPEDSAGQRRPGRDWVGGDVQAGLRLLDMLRSTTAWPHVAGADVSRFLDDNLLVIRTTEGAEVEWGGAPGSKTPGEQPDDKKLRRFEALVTSGAWINAGRARVELHTPYVYFDESSPGASGTR